MSEVVSYELKGNIGVISVNNPPVNALAQVVREGILNSIQAAQEDASKAIVLRCEGRTFIAGADITEFGKPPKDPGLPIVLDAIENSSKPVIAAIHGTALGGGFEVSLACHYRCAVASAKVGLPEVKLGLLPGAGGTQRVPRIAGVKAALDMITSGNPIAAGKAHTMGLVDEIIEADYLEAGAIEYAKGLVESGAPLKRIRDITIDPATIEADFFANARKQLARRARGQIAQDKIVSCIEAAVELPMDEGLQRERELFRELITSPESAAMRHIFFAERRAAKIKDLSKDTPVRDIAKVAIIGGGTMGGGIAMNFANAGIPVTVIEVDADVLEKGLEVTRKNYASTVAKGRLSQDDMDRRVGLIAGSTDYGDVADADIVIEAAFEDMALKKEIFQRLDQTCKAETIITSNTSSLDIDEIAAATGRPEKVMGTHFFSPANVMRLAENVRGAKTSKETIATVMGFSKAIGKVGVLVGICDGFVGNRMLYAYTRQAGFLLEEGALPEQVDKVIYDFGLPMGPFAMGDLAGIDVGWLVRQAQEPTRPKHLRYSDIADRIYEMDRYGQKTQAGWYRYEKGSRAPTPDPEIEKLIVSVSEELGIERRAISDQEILERCMYPMINEGAKILEEGIALRALDIDIIWIYGFGFPRYRGGPMFYADLIGADKIYDAMSRLYEEHGEWLKPAPLLKKLAKEGKGFGDL